MTKRDGLRPALLRSAWPFGQGQSHKLAWAKFAWAISAIFAIVLWT